MTELIRAIVAKYRESPSLEESIGSIWLGEAGQNFTTPYTVIHLLAGDQIITFQRELVLENTRVQLSVYADTLNTDVILQHADAIKSRFDGAELVFSTGYPVLCEREAQNLVKDVTPRMTRRDPEAAWRFNAVYTIIHQ